MKKTLRHRLLQTWLAQSKEERGKEIGSVGEILAWFSEDMLFLIDSAKVTKEDY